MFVRVDLGGDPPFVALEDPADCTRFHVEVVNGDDLELASEVLTDAGVGRIDESGAAFVEVVAVRSLAEGRVGSGWLRDFNAMLEFATSKGWMSADGAEIEAHVERPGSAGA
jgi:hypothetical protein